MKIKEIKKILDGLKKKGISVVLYHPDIGTAATMVDELGRFKIIEHIRAEIEFNVFKNKELAASWLKTEVLEDYIDINDKKIKEVSYIG